MTETKDSPRRALLLVDHGSRLAEANQVLEEMAQRLRRESRFDLVVASHMELAAPSVAEGLARCLESGADEVVVQPCFLTPGRHSSEDIPRLVAQGAAPPCAARIVVAQPLGALDGVCQAVVQRAEEALGGPGRRGGGPSLLLRREDCFLAVLDIQDALLPHIFNGEALVRACVYLIRAARQLGVPIVLTEQYSKGLGRTNAAILEALPQGVEPVEKLTFSSWAAEGLRAALPPRRRAVLLCGMETHICLMQTAFGALEAGYRVAAACDATGSRREADHRAALERMRSGGVIVGTAEMLVFEMLGRAGTEEFRALLPLLKAGPGFGPPDTGERK